MITETQAEAIKKVLGKYAAATIASHFNEIGFKTPRGAAYTPKMVGYHLRGERVNQELEEKIVAFVASERARMEKAAETRDKLFKEILEE